MDVSEVKGIELAGTGTDLGWLFSSPDVGMSKESQNGICSLPFGF